MYQLNTKQKIFIARIIQTLVKKLCLILGKKTSGVFQRKGLQWYLDLNEGIDFAIYLLGVFEASTLKAYKKLIKEGDIVFDIGANVGAHTLHLASMVGARGQVFAFEPTSWAFAKLQKNISLNPNLSRRIKAYQILLSDKKEETAVNDIKVYASWPLENNNPNSHHTHMGVLKETTGAIQTSLDTFIENKKIPHVDLIKLDVDGHEAQILHGGIRLLSAFKPDIIIEIAPYLLKENKDVSLDIIKSLISIGYKFYIIDSLSLINDIEHYIKILPPQGSANIIASVKYF